MKVTDFHCTTHCRTHTVVVYGVFFVTLGLPISAVTFNMQTQPVECAVSASIGMYLIHAVVCTCCGVCEGQYKHWHAQ